MATSRIIVLDDDPTGSQTVHGCLLLTRWDVATLRTACLDESPLFFVLTNTRGMSARQAAEVTGEVCRNLKVALAQLESEGTAIHPIVVSRSDSTLRGHYPVETDVIAREMGPFDAHFLVPAFFEGGRVTRNSVHYLMVDGEPVPVHETEFAKDSVFGYHNSYLPDYVEEKTGGRITADQVERFTLDNMKGDTVERLMQLHGNTCCVVDADTQQGLDRFAQDLNEAAQRGKRFLFRSAASLLTALARLPAQPIAAGDMHEVVRDARPGTIIVGSHVRKTSQQLEALLQQPLLQPIEIDVGRLPGAREALLEQAVGQARAAHTAGKTSVIYTSRQEVTFDDHDVRLAFGESVSALLMDIVRRLPREIGFLISKGGITSNDVLSSGLSLKTSRVLGQILAGCSVVRCPQDHDRYPGLPVVIFPGNVGGEDALATVYRRLAGLNEDRRQLASGQAIL